jgi:hypothetical protein
MPLDRFDKLLCVGYIAGNRFCPMIFWAATSASSRDLYLYSVL